MEMKKLLIGVISSIFFLLFTVNLSFALPSVLPLFKGDGTLNELEDDDLEWIEYDANSDGILDVGDTLRGVFQIQTFNGANVDEGGSYTGISGLFEVEVAGKVLVDSTLGLYDFSFVPHANADGLSTNSMIAFYEDDTPLAGFMNTPGTGLTRDQLEAAMTDGTLLYEFGFNGDPDEYWVATDAQDQPGLAVNATLWSGEYNVALSNIVNNFLPVVQTPFTDFVDSGFLGTSAAVLYPGRTPGDDKIDLFGGGGFSGTLLYTNTNGEVVSDGNFYFATVPEPTTMILLGLGLLGMAGVSRKRQA